MPTFIALLLFISIAFGTKIDKNEDGATVMVRPDEGEEVVITPTTVPGIENFWVVHPDAIRQANAEIARLQPYEEATTLLTAEIASCDEEREADSAAYGNTAHDLAVCTGSLRECRKEKWRAFFMGSTGGAALATVIFIAILI